MASGLPAPRNPGGTGSRPRGASVAFLARAKVPLPEGAWTRRRRGDPAFVASLERARGGHDSSARQSKREKKRWFATV